MGTILSRPAGLPRCQGCKSLTWLALLADAGVSQLRIHDLRHTFASYALSGGQTLGTVGQLLGHTSIQSTRRYAHLVEDAARTAVARIEREVGV